jgi:PAS domain S-box-containing protein
MIEREPLSAVIEVLDTGIIVLDDAQRVVVWNDWIALASRVSAAQAGSKTLAEIFPDKMPARLQASISEALTLNSSSFLTNTLNRHLLPLKTRASLEMIHNISVRPLGEGSDRKCLVQIVDVTGSTHRERVLRERLTARYDAVVESAPDAILTLDAEGLIQSANPSASRELGYSQQELTGRPLATFFEGDISWSQFLRSVLSDSVAPHPIELVARRKDGSKSFLEVSASRWMNAAHVSVTAILHDVNARHAAEEVLRNLNATLEHRVAERTKERDQVWQVSRDMLGVVAPDGTWISVNPAWERILGWRQSEIIGRSSEWLEHPDDVQKFRAEFNRLALTEKTFSFESTLRTRNDDYRVFSWTAVNEEGLLYCVARDVTDQRAQEAALAKAEDALRQSQKMEAVGQLTGGLAHDFNNLLTGISGSLELLQIRISQGRYKDVERYISTAQGASKRAAALTHRLLAFSRRQTLDPKTTDVNQLVAGMRDLINNTLGPTIEPKVVEAKQLWSTLVDPNQLENALLNLCINARDAMPNGGHLTIETANCSFDAGTAVAWELRPGDYVALFVSDTGTGMTEDVIQRAFDPFYTTKPLGQGTGLGLSMIYGFVKQSGGQVRITSKLDEGTTIHLYLPRHDDWEKTAEEKTDLARAPRATTGDTVLIVDDEPSVRMLVTEVLAELGYTAIEAADGSSALRVLQSDTRIDLLVTDVGLPGGMNGRQLADFGRVARPKLKVLFITGYAEKNVVGSDQLEPGMGILTKPFAMEGLAARIKELISAK